MEWSFTFSVLWGLILVAVCMFCWLLTLVTLPGNWLMAVAAGAYVFFVPTDQRLFEWPVVGVLVGLAVLGEVIEMAAAAAGVAKVGGRRRSGVLALFGSLGGAFVGALVGLPIPVIGPVVGVLLFAAAGALLGAMLGEKWAGSDTGQSFKVGHAAFWGRLLGTVGKMLVASIMVASATAALLIP